MKKGIEFAAHLHENVPPDWYYRSIKENALQRYWHSRRFEEVEKLIEPVDGKILDIGCADGVFTKVILDKSKATQIIGIDVLKTSVDWAKKHWKKNRKMKFVVKDAHKLSFEKNSFSAVFALEVLEHVADPAKVLRETKRILKKGGWAIFLVPSDSRLFNVVWWLWKRWRGRIWEDTHIQTYRKNYLPRLCRSVGFKVVEDKKFILGMLHLVKVEKT